MKDRFTIGVRGPKTLENPNEELSAQSCCLWILQRQRRNEESCFVISQKSKIHNCLIW